ncbi:hypothetical protein ACNKHV_22720 [Shigella flexneri]
MSSSRYGLISAGGVHSHEDHIMAMVNWQLNTAQKNLPARIP